MKKILTPLPYNFEVEQGLLGILLHSNHLLEEVVNFLHEDHFYDPLHGEIYKTIKNYVDNNKVANPLTLQQYFDVGGDDKKSSYLLNLSQSIISLSNALSYGEHIYDLYLRRQLIFLGNQVVEEASTFKTNKNAKDTLEGLERNLFVLAEKGKRDGEVKHLKEALAYTLNAAEKAYKKTTHIIGLPTGLKGLDEMLGGLHPSDLLIVAGRPGMGKTALATNIAFNVAASPIPILLFSLEMSAEQLALRILSQNVNISSDAIRKGDLEMDDFLKFSVKIKQLGEFPFYIDDTPFLNISALRTRARRLHRKHGIQLVVVDYIQLVASDRPGRENRVQELAEITRGLKGLAKELNVPIIALSQLSRAVEAREDKRPQLADLRGSGSIEQDADVVMFVYREEYYKSIKKAPEGRGIWGAKQENISDNLAELIVAKQRNGPIGTIKLNFNKSLTKFMDLDSYE
ncbi:MAG TPA: replicative DNA helicase [Candidatus Babeliaceae bacterium]|nr:replicative DNA helicase [Candidatus Babeliaceae bacterium]